MIKINKFSDFSNLNELHTIPKDILYDIIGDKYTNMSFNIEDMYKSYSEGRFQESIDKLGVRPNQDFYKWIKSNY